jgi:hypothetical protein
MVPKGLVSVALSLAAIALGSSGCDEGAATVTVSAWDAGPWQEGPPWLAQRSGGRYFVVDGCAQPVLARNICARDVAEYTAFLEAARNAGTRLVRFQLTQGMGSSLGIMRSGAVDEVWARKWDSVLAAASSRGISVIPVFAIWGDWNDGSPAMGWANWGSNPLAASLGGPARSPADLLSDTPARTAWIGWMSALVARWRAHANIAAWEILSELDLVTGATESSATGFAEFAADAIRAADTYRRPIMGSTSDLVEWPELWASRANDLVQIHPYEANLDSAVLDRVKLRIAATPKPVMVGESGLVAAVPDGTTLSSAPRADVGLRHAIWAEVVSGAVDARALWWEDGYGTYLPATGLPLVQAMASLEATVPAFLRGIDFTGLEPASATERGPILGAVLARSDLAVGWYRDANCVAPDWTCDVSISGASVSLGLPGVGDGAWPATFFDPVSGQETSGTATVIGSTLSMELPSFRDSIAFRAGP